MFPDILSPFIIFLIPQTSCRAASAAVRLATEEGGTSQEPDHIQVQQNIRVAVFTRLLPISIKLCLLFFRKVPREREGVNSVPALFICREIHLWLLDGIPLPVRLVHKPNKCLDSKENCLFRLSRFPRIGCTSARAPCRLYICVCLRAGTRSNWIGQRCVKRI